MTWLARPETTKRLDDMVREFARIDADEAARLRRQENDALVTRALRNWFRKTDKTDDEEPAS
jgi:hypothetical protein